MEDAYLLMLEIIKAIPVLKKQSGLPVKKTVAESVTVFLLYMGYILLYLE